MPNILSSFETAKTSADAKSIPAQQLECIELRLKTIAPRAALRKIKLQYLEHRVSQEFYIKEVSNNKNYKNTTKNTSNLFYNILFLIFSLILFDGQGDKVFDL